jgi:transposase
MINLGENVKNFCEVIGKHRSLIYTWLGKDASGSLENKKPVAKTYPGKISEVKRAEVVTEYFNLSGFLGEWSLSKMVGGISASKTGEILRDIRSHYLMHKQQVE